MRDSIVFYRSFYEAIKELPAEAFKESVKAILDYGLDEKEPEQEGTIAHTVFRMAKPQIDANNRRFRNGCKGGKPNRNQTVTKADKEEPSDNQIVTKTEPNRNQTVTKAEPNEKGEMRNVNEKGEINKKNTESTSYSCPELGNPASAQTFIALPLIGGVEYQASVDEVTEWKELYPAVDVEQELRKMRGWLLADPKRRKTSRGIKRFVTGWLAREQDRGGTRQRSTKGLEDWVNDTC